MSGNPEVPPVPGKEEMQDHSAPPPGLFPAQDQQTVPQSASSEAPPAYADHEPQQAPPEKAASANVATPQVGEQSQQYYPPPPPGPPPAQAQPEPAAYHSAKSDDDLYDGPPPPLPGPRPNAEQQPQQPQQPQPSQHSQRAAGSGPHIPAYNPAQQQFAAPPPPGSHQQPGNLSSQPSAYEQEQSGHRSWGSLFTEMGNKAAAPINALANKMGSQSFLPTTMDKECDKAAHILRSFCKEGITSDASAVKTEHDSSSTAESGKEKERHRHRGHLGHGTAAIVKIPSKYIAKAQGLAIFTTARAGWALSGATGSGILIARRPDGSWSPPSGIQVHALGAGFMLGVDIYDCVCVINSREALGAFMSTRVSLGPDVAIAAGPYGAGGVMDFGSTFQTPDDRKAAEAQKAQLAQQEQQQQQQQQQHEIDQGNHPTGAEGEGKDDNGKLRPGKGHHRRSSSMSLKPVFTYVKSRGFYAGVQVDGTVITERKDANAAFYGHKVGVEQILRGEVPAQGPGGAAWPSGAQSLYEALRVAEAQKPLPDANMPPPPAPTNDQQQQQQQQQFPGPPQMSGSAAGASGPQQQQEGLPGYVDDGVQRPGVGDEKVRYE